MTVATVYPVKPDPVRDFIAHCCGNADIVPLDSLSAPLVAQMQEAIRLQNQILQRASAAIQYLLMSEQPFRSQMYATQAEAFLCDSLAEIDRIERRDIARQFDCFHREAPCS